MFNFVVRSAQNDANFRKEKIQSLKGREGKPKNIHRNASAAIVSASPNSQLHQVERLLKEIDTLKETNKRLASQVQVPQCYHIQFVRKNIH